MKIILFVVFTATFISLAVTDGSLKVLDITDRSANLLLTKPAGDINIWYLILAVDKNTSQFSDSPMSCTKNPNYSNADNCRLSGLIPGHTYQFIVYSKYWNANTWNPANIQNIEVTTDNPSDKPNSPRGPLSVSNMSDTTAHLKWQKPENTTTTFVSYQITAFTDFLGRETSNPYYYVSDSDFPEYTVTGLYRKHKYKFQILALNNKGHSDFITSEDVMTTLTIYNE
ncbi:uncharacterized protein LOC127278111 [Leptopilina boulardi]|uniref:uncharacterized protein LOC127278111 n=1 Tax=Leptopilina boulardi TaxID=63433 RepID=UPI0021F67AC6|nr:uncharacterized protein LOC127278111 [Leptopilina boulardi]